MPLTAEELLDLTLHPAPVKIYKPSMKDLSGTALALDLRLDPVMGKSPKGTKYITSIEGGLFLELVPQATMKSGDKDATFAWDSPKRISAKLGLPDITALLIAIRSRWARRATPAKLRTKSDQVGSTVGMFHKYAGDEGSTTNVISYELKGDQAFLRMSKGKEHQLKITIEMAEELLLEERLLQALRSFQLVGKR